MVTLAKIAGRLAFAARAGVDFKRVLVLPDAICRRGQLVNVALKKISTKCAESLELVSSQVDEFLRGRDTYSHFLKVESRLAMASWTAELLVS